MKIRLIYALASGPCVELIDAWPSTWAALDYAASMGAVVASAKRLEPAA